jgi:hypothetical protein
MGGRMRLLSMFFTVVVVTLLAALGATAAAAQSTGQTLETREMNRSESTTRAPDPGQSDRNVQVNAACPGAVLIDSVGPTDEDLVTARPFTVTGESFRLTYETTNADESGLPFFDVTVLDEAGKEVGGRVIFEEGTQQELVRASPGRFDIEAVADDLEYTLTIEDCTGDGNPSGGSGGDGGSADDGQYGNNGEPPGESPSGPPGEDVIDDTISDEPLPNTGGVPLFGVGFFGFLCVFAAFALLRPAIRRDS